MDKIDNYKAVQEYKFKSKANLNAYRYEFWEKLEYLEEDMYPQGLCMTEEYVFITLYSDIKGALGVVKVFDKYSGAHMLSLGLDARSHMGGIACDGESVWVCNSSRMAIERIGFDLIRQMINENPGKFIDARNLVEIHKVKNIPSTVTFYEGQIWVATHSAWTNATLVSYRYDANANILASIGTFRVPEKVQGIAFTELGEVVLSTSYGRKKNSYIKKYSSLHAMSVDVGDYIEKIELPPCSEGVVYYENKYYVLFESAGKKYREGTDGKGKTPAPLDKILIISAS